MTNYLNDGPKRTKRIPASTLMEWGRVTGTRWEWLQTGEGPWLADWPPLTPSEVLERHSGCTEDVTPLLYLNAA